MGFLGKLSEGIKKGVDGVQKEMQRREEIKRQKLQILNQLDMNQLKKVCKDYGIGEPLNYDQATYMLNGRKIRFTLTRNHYSGYIMNRMTLDQIRSMGKKLRLIVPEITSIQEEPIIMETSHEENIEPIIITKSTKSSQKASENQETDEEEPKALVSKHEEKLKEIIKQIEAFRPNKVFNKESEYENTLYTRLEVFFPNIEQQVPFANSRIDIKIDGFGIEIKNHPDQNEINRLVGQLISYKKFFRHIIVVIFNPRDLKALKYLKEQIKDMGLAVTIMIK